jgi:AraC family transcriptional regulator
VTERFDIAAWSSGAAKAVHCRLAPWRAREFVSVSDPSSVAIAFTGQRRAVVQVDGQPASERDVPPDAAALCGEAPIAWLAVNGPSDLVEITAGPELRAEVAGELAAARHAHLADIDGWADPVLLAIARRFRSGLRGWDYQSELERDELVRVAYGRALIGKFGGRARRAGRLDEARLRRVTDYVAAQGGRELTIAELAAAAALSPFHFARSFKLATGLTPHAYVTGWRLARAAERLKAGATVEQAASEVGFSNQRHFRRLFRREYGAGPADARA